MAVSFYDAGPMASTSGAVSSITADFPAGAGAGQTALLIVSVGFGYRVSIDFDTPAGWSKVHDITGGSGTQVAVFSRTLTDTPDPVSVSLRSIFKDYIDNVTSRILVFDGAIRTTRSGSMSSGQRSLGVSIPAEGAGLWVSFVGAIQLTSPVIDSGVSGETQANLGYILSAAGEYVEWNGGVVYNNLAAMVLEPRSGPSAPTLLAPLAGQELPNTAAAVFSWLHNGFNSPQAAFELRVKLSSSGTWSYVTAAGTITATPTVVTTSQQSIAVAAAQFTDLVGYDWSLRTQDTEGAWSPYTSTRTFSLVPPPTVTIIAPVTNLTDDLSPTVMWAALSGSKLQVAFRVEAVVGGVVIYDSGTMLGSQTSFTLPPQDDFTNGAATTFRVTLTQTGGATGSDTSTVTLSWSTPTAPTIAVGAGTNGIDIVIGGDLDTLNAVERSTDGSNWTPVASNIVMDAATVTVVDVLAPYDVAVTYRVRSSKLLDNQKLATAWVVSAPVTSSDKGFYLVDSLDLQSFLAANLMTDTERRFVRGGSLAYPLGSFATVDFGPMQGDAGSFNVMTETQAEASAMYAFLTLNRAFWIRWCPDDGIDLPPTLVTSTPDPIIHERTYQYAKALRDWPVDWVEQLPQETTP